MQAMDFIKEVLDAERDILQVFILVTEFGLVFWRSEVSENYKNSLSKFNFMGSEHQGAAFHIAGVFWNLT